MGKRVKTENKSRVKNVEKKPSAGKTAAVLLVLLAALAVGCYGWMCQRVDENRILSDVTIEGISVQGMAPEEAKEAVLLGFRERCQGVPLELYLEGETFSVTPWTEEENLLALDTDTAIAQAMEFGHGAFWTRGWAWLMTQLAQESQALEAELTVTDPEALAQLIAASGIEEVNTAVETNYEVTEEEILITKGTSGVVADPEATALLAQELILSGRWPEARGIDCSVKSSGFAALNVRKIYEEIFAEPVDATLDPEQDYAVVPSVMGVSFDTERAAQLLEQAEEGEQISVALELTEPAITTELMEENLFRDQLGSYTTTVTGSSGRKSNVRLAAEYCNDTILLPGEVFSYNGVVGQRTKARGFLEAPAYQNGQTVQELGGGICQVSSTLYCACLYSNLEITERTNHSFASSYVPLGMDATVSWGGPDYKFTNNTPYPIKVVCDYSGSKLTISLLGTKLDDITVEIISKTLETIPYGTKREKDDGMKKGDSKTIVTPYTGYKVQTYRKLLDGQGNLISNQEEAYSYYRKRDKVIAYND